MCIVGVDAVLAHKPEFLGSLWIVGVQSVPEGTRAVVVAVVVKLCAVHVVPPAVEAVLQRRVHAKVVRVKIAVDRHDGTRPVLLLDHLAPVGKHACRVCRAVPQARLVV